VELHGGPSPTFWDTLTLGPGESLAWTETWLPLRDLPALDLATDEVALGVEAVGADPSTASGQSLRLGFLSASQRDHLDARLWRLPGCALLWSVEDVSLAPGEVFGQQLDGLGLGADQVVLGLFQGETLLAATADSLCWLPGPLWTGYLPLVLKNSP